MYIIFIIYSFPMSTPIIVQVLAGRGLTCMAPIIIFYYTIFKKQYFIHKLIIYSFPMSTPTIVRVLAGRGLTSMDPNGLSDPYCVLGEANPRNGEFIDPTKCTRSEVYISFFFFFVYLFL